MEIERTNVHYLSLDSLPDAERAEAVRIISSRLSTRARDHLAPTLAERAAPNTIDVTATLDLIHNLVDLVNTSEASRGDQGQAPIADSARAILVRPDEVARICAHILRGQADGRPTGS